MTYHPSTMLLPTAATMPNRDKTVANHDATTTNRAATAPQPRRAPANTGVPWRTPAYRGEHRRTVASTGATVASHDATLAQQPYNYNNKWKIKHRHDITLPYTNNNTSLKHHASSLDHIHIAR